MKTIIFTLGVLFTIALLGTPSSAEEGQLYGKIYTVDDEEFEGFIRWDKNEASWVDILNGTKELDRKRHKRYRDSDRRRGKRVTLFGLTIYSESGDYYGWDWVNEAQSGLRMGHIRSLVPIGDNEVLLELKSGEEVELSGGSGDIGDDNREILVDDNREGVIELYWDEIDRVDFGPAPVGESAFGKRLYGTLTTRRGHEFTGFVCWDMDEVFEDDILDGREGRRNRKIKFGNIASIERRSSSAATVTMKNGKKMKLDDTNDVNSGNRGIVIADINLGSVEVGWDEFDILEFREPPASPGYDDFDGGRRLKGTVLTEDGEEFTGEIKWDDDEESTWEILDGDLRDINFDIEFGMVKSIEKLSSRSSLVTLKDGRSFKLKGSNDIDSENKGIFVYTGDDEIVVDWEDFEMIEFSE
ncbi:MAG: hypothetical protein JSU69_00335 [Candidatus Zixiibacteriota bacterium]|nr:MAG: hypothetical protein JSU69_00335 [candidate division Zixibacteria bacterium]